MKNISKSIEIHIFCEKSKTIGGGHYTRSSRIFNLLKKRYTTFFYTNSTSKKIYKILNNKKKKILFFDYQNYKKIKFPNLKNNYYFFLDNELKLNKRSTNICPLIFKNRKYYGPKWLIMPKNIKKKRYIRKIKNILILQGLTDAKNNIKKIYLSIKDYCKQNDISIYTRRKDINSKDKFLQVYDYKKNIHSFFRKKIDLAITGIGNSALELGYQNIPCIFVSELKHEIKRGKILEKKRIGKFFSSTDNKGIIAEISKLRTSKKYYRMIILNQKKFFKKFNKKIYMNLINNIINEKF